MNRSYPHFPSFSIIFHHFPSFSIIFHHFPSFSIIFHRSTHGQNLVSMFLPGDGHPSDPSDPGMQRQEPSPKVMQVLQVRPAAPPTGPKWSTHRPIGISWDWPSRWLFYDEFCFWYWAMGYLGSFFDVLEVLGDWEIPHLQIIDVFACFCHQGLHW